MYFAGGAIVLLVAFMLVLIYSGQVEFAKQIATHLGALIAGAYSGYNYGIRRGKDKKANDE